MVVLGISGSLRGGSLNSRLLLAAGRELPPGATLRVWDGLRDVPPYDEDADGEPAPSAVRRLREALADADAVLIATPEYNASVPGQLKNAIDWASRPRDRSVLRFLPVAVVGATTGAFGAVWAQAELRKVLATAGARVVEGELGVGHAHERLDAGGAGLDADQRAQLRELMAALVAEARVEAAAA